MKNNLFHKTLVLGVTAALLITAVPSEPARAAKIKINKSRASLYVGGKIKLKIKGTTRKVKWSSNRKRVASVNVKGRVTAKKAGKAVITGKIASKKYRCRITVKRRPDGNITPPASPKISAAPTKTPQTTMSPVPSRTPAGTILPSGSPSGTIPPVSSVSPGTSTGTMPPVPPSSPAVSDTPSGSMPPTSSSEPGGPSSGTLQFDAGEYSIAKIHSGDGTYYDRISTGASNLDYLESSYYTVAMNNTDYMNGLAGAFLEITDKDGDVIQAVVTDRLPEGKKGDIDLTRKAFSAIEPLDTGRMDITWKIIPFPTNDPVSYVFKPTSSQYWSEVQVRNHRYPIARLEYLDTVSGQYIELPRQEYNYFTASSGMGNGPYTFRLTDFYGHVLIDTGISMNSTETPVIGAANFPY